MPIFIADIQDFDAAYAKVIEDDFESSHSFADEFEIYESHLFAMTAAPQDGVNIPTLQVPFIRETHIPLTTFMIRIPNQSLLPPQIISPNQKPLESPRPNNMESGRLARLSTKPPNLTPQPSPTPQTPTP